MAKLKEVLFRKIKEHRPRTQSLLKNSSDVRVGEVTIGQVIGGARGVRCLVTDISYLDPYEGIRFRGKTIPESFAALPKYPGRAYPSVEAFYWFLLTGDPPTQQEADELTREFVSRRPLPQYVIDLIRAMPRDTHPMTMFSAAILAMQRESLFVKRYNEGLKKDDYWDPMYEDCTNLLAKIPLIAAYIYRMKYRSDIHIPSNNELDLGGNFAWQMGFPEPCDDVARMHFILHSDHESGNVCSHTTHLVASALSDAYYALSAGMNGLAGPLHGLASQEVLRWIMNVRAELGNKIPSEEEMKKYVWDTLESGQVVPGYGHAVLRKTDPRYTAQREFCLKHLPDDPLFKYVDLLYKVVPDILEKQGKAKNPWPNVDAQSGVIHWHYGLTEWDFYTVLFGIGRAIGVLANIIWDRALGYPIERPKSLTTKMLEDLASNTIRLEDIPAD
ncbi:MAG: citrate (Si)-synthase [Acidobacteria bacterium]|nr:citrate (Si)-synthase [Acidobacteriota bacterium]